MLASKHRTLTVIDKQKLSPNMFRISLGGEALNDFPEGQESGYVKLVFPKISDSGDKNGGFGFLKSKKNLMRSYTIRKFNADAYQLDLDVVVHGDNGPASAWAIKVAPGEEITVGGPGPTKLADPEADWFFFAGDMTALPAISVNLEKLPANARGYAVLEVIDPADRLDLKVPDNMQIHWVINQHPDMENTILADKVKSLDWLEGEPYVCPSAFSWRSPILPSGCLTSDHLIPAVTGCF